MGALTDDVHYTFLGVTNGVTSRFYALGVDLGRARDYTALTVLRTPRAIPGRTVPRRTRAAR